MKDKYTRILYWMVDHNSLIQLILFLMLIIIQTVLTACNINNLWLILTGFGFISAELLQISIMLGYFRLGENKNILAKRSGTAIKDIAYTAQKELFITGLNNHGAINYLYNDNDLISYFVKKNIKVNLLLLDIYDNDLLEQYCKFFFGKNDITRELEIVRSQADYSINQLHTYDALRPLVNNNLLNIKYMDTPISTAFVASDLGERNGVMQCIFYQYGKTSSESPCIVLSKKDNMYDEMCLVLKNMWNNSTSTHH